MKRIEIQGAIEPAVPTDLFGDWIADGLFTPVNAFARALREAEDAGEEIEVWINSPGGSVDAANEMLAAFQSFRGYKCVTVGGLAASAAAYFALMCGARVECHENTRFMFHAPCFFNGGGSGAGALRDEAAALDKIAAPVKARLVALGLPAAQVEEGFRDERALWLSADEALRIGLVQKIAKGSAALPKAATSAQLASMPEGLASVAAHLRAYSNPPRNYQTTAAMNDEDPKPADTPAEKNPPPAPDAAAPADSGAPADPAPGAGSDEPEPKPAPEGPPAPKAALPDAAQTLADALSRAEALATANLKRAETAEKALAAAQATIAQYEKDAAKLGARASALAEALDTAKQQHAALVGKVLKPDDTPGSWPDAIKACGGDVAKALRAYPDLAQAFRAAHGAKAPTA